MPDPITMDIPHRLGRDGARRRIENGIGDLARAIPGGSVQSHAWEGDTLTFVVQALGQRVSAKLDVLETSIHAELDLPPFAALFADKVKAALVGAGTRVLR